MRRPLLAALVYLCAGPIAFADIEPADRTRLSFPGARPDAGAAVREGMLMPPSALLSDIPAAYRDGYGTYDAYRFAMVDGHGAIVDPQTRRIIGVLP
jgi:hypothetical protein